jgi:hypothetical protein
MKMERFEVPVPLITSCSVILNQHCQVSFAFSQVRSGVSFFAAKSREFNKKLFPARYKIERGIIKTVCMHVALGLNYQWVCVTSKVLQGAPFDFLLHTLHQKETL